MKGWLHLDKSGKWEKLYFVLRGTLLSGFNNEREENLLEGFELQEKTEIRSLPSNYRNYDFCFEISSGNHEYIFGCSSIAERNNWVDALKKFLSMPYEPQSVEVIETQNLPQDYAYLSSSGHIIRKKEPNRLRRKDLDVVESLLDSYDFENIDLKGSIESHREI